MKRYCKDTLLVGTTVVFSMEALFFVLEDDETALLLLPPSCPSSGDARCGGTLKQASIFFVRRFTTCRVDRCGVRPTLNLMYKQALLDITDTSIAVRVTSIEPPPAQA